LSNIKTAVIMAAGMGIRLKELGRLVPKGFIRLGAKPIIEESVEKLKGVGIERIVIVTGHLAYFYDELARTRNGLIQTVHNGRYADSGSLYSLYLAKALVRESFLLLESDLIYEARALQEALAFPKPDVVLLSGPTLSGDEVYVQTEAGKLANMSKDRRALASNVAGELVGISKISAELFAVLVQQAELLFRSSIKVDYESGLVVSARVHPIFCHRLQDLVWAEIDDEHHLVRAKERIYPRLRVER